MRDSNGYSLIELVITLAIIAILASVSYPIYTHHIMSARRKHAEAMLLSLAERMENYHNIHDTYRKATLASLQIDTRNEPYYEFILKLRGDEHYFLKARPIKSQINDGCGILELSETGEQKAFGREPFNCW